MPQTKKSHIKRCIGVIQGEDGSITPYDLMSIDVMRIDDFLIEEKDGAYGLVQKQTVRLKWQDKEDKFEWETDEESQGSKAKKRRSKKTHVVKVTDPTDPPPKFKSDDKFVGPKVYIPIRCIDSLALREAGIRTQTTKELVMQALNLGYQGMHEIKQRLFKNKRFDKNGNEIETKRDVLVIRVEHYDTNKEEDLSVENLRVVSSGVYEYGEKGEQDDKGRPKEYVDYEITNFYKYMHVSDYTKWKAIFKAKEYYRDTLGVDPENIISDRQTSEGHRTFPIRLDPFQFVVNVSWPAATEFTPASLITVDNVNISDTATLLISLWVRIPKDVINKYGSVKVWTWGAYDQELTGITETSVPTKKRGSYVSVDSSGNVQVYLESSNKAQPLYKCDDSEYEVNLGKLQTTADPDWVDAGEVGINVLRFETVPDWVDDEDILGVKMKSRFTAQRNPVTNVVTNNGVGLVEYIAEPPGPTGSFQLKAGDAIYPPPGLPAYVNVDWTFTGTKKFPGEKINEGVTPYFLAVSQSSNRGVFEFDKWNNILIRTDTSIPTSATWDEASGIVLIDSAPIIEMYVNAIDVTPTPKGGDYGQCLPSRFSPDLPGLDYHGKYTDSSPYDIECHVGGHGDTPNNRPMKVETFAIELSGKPMSIPIQEKAMRDPETGSDVQLAATIEYAQAVMYTDFTRELETTSDFFVQIPEPDEKINAKSAQGVKITPYGFMYQKFGPPKVHLEGRPEQFVEDRGAADLNFAETGELKRYVPRPPLGGDPANAP